MHILMKYTRPTIVQVVHNNIKYMASACVCYELTHGVSPTSPHFDPHCRLVQLSLQQQLGIVCTNAGGPHLLSPYTRETANSKAIYIIACMAIDRTIKLQRRFSATQLILCSIVYHPCTIH